MIVPPAGATGRGRVDRRRAGLVRRAGQRRGVGDRVAQRTTSGTGGGRQRRCHRGDGEALVVTVVVRVGDAGGGRGEVRRPAVVAGRCEGGRRPTGRSAWCCSPRPARRCRWTPRVADADRATQGELHGAAPGRDAGDRDGRRVVSGDRPGADRGRPAGDALLRGHAACRRCRSRRGRSPSASPWSTWTSASRTPRRRSTCRRGRVPSG